MNLWNLTMTNIGLNIGLYRYGNRSDCHGVRGDYYGHRPKTEQSKSAYVSRKPIWRTLPEPSSFRVVDRAYKW